MLFEYSVEQRTYEISGVKIGGEPGLAPTVMIGSMFYKGHKIVSNSLAGEFDEDRAESIVNRMEEQSEKTGLPSMVDMVAENAAAAETYMDFLVDASRMPILLDVLSEEGQRESLRYAKDHGFLDRIILNSISPHTNESVYRTMEEVGCKNAVLQLYSTETLLKSNKRELLEALASKAMEHGIENPIIDVPVLDIPTLGMATKAIYDIKDAYGYPSGCGAHNAIASWRGLKTKFTKKAAATATGVANALAIAVGADFVFYGPAGICVEIYPSIALIDASYSQLMYERRIRPDGSHPRFKIS